MMAIWEFEESENSITKKIKNTSGMYKYAIIISPDNIIIAKGKGLTTTINTPKTNIVYIADTEEEIKQLIIDNGYIEEING